jgi:polyisoprenoid-binding protein YceI
MRSIMFALVAAVCTVASAGAQSVSTDAKQAPTGRYALDAHHSQILFSILHQGTTYYYGRFDRLSGTLNFAGSAPDKSAVSIDIDMTSIDMPSQALNGILTAKEVFDVQQFPTATFRSTSVVRTGPNTGKIMGDLTIKNVTKSVTLDAVFNGGSLNPMSDSYAIGFSATTTIRRTDFGITGMRWEPFVGNEVKLIIETGFQQSKD